MGVADREIVSFWSLADSNKKKKWLSREEITTFRFERRLCLSKHAEQDSTENSEPKQVTQERERDLQNYFDDKAQ